MTVLNPWRLLGGCWFLTLDFADLPATEQGRYYPALHVILLQRSLLQVERRCTLAHELAHFILDHAACTGRPHDRQERAADDLAARWLISLDALADAQLWGRSPAEVADELHVDLHTLKTRIAGLTPDERDYINRRLRAREGAA